MGPLNLGGIWPSRGAAPLPWDSPSQPRGWDASGGLEGPSREDPSWGWGWSFGSRAPVCGDLSHPREDEWDARQAVADTIPFTLYSACMSWFSVF